MKSLFIALAVVSFSAAAFADPCPTSIEGSCSSPQNLMTCVDAVANTFPSGSFENACANSPGTTNVFYAAPCKSENIVGSCLLNSYQGGTAQVVLRLYAPLAAQVVPAVCAQSHGVVCQ